MLNVCLSDKLAAGRDRINQSAIAWVPRREGKGNEGEMWSCGRLQTYALTFLDFFLVLPDATRER